MAGPHQLFCIKLPSFSHLNLSSLVNYSDPTPSSTPLQLRTSNLASSKPASWVEKSNIQLNLQRWVLNLWHAFSEPQAALGCTSSALALSPGSQTCRRGEDVLRALSLSFLSLIVSQSTSVLWLWIPSINTWLVLSLTKCFSCSVPVLCGESREIKLPKKVQPIVLESSHLQEGDEKYVAILYFWLGEQQLWQIC